MTQKPPADVKLPGRWVQMWTYTFTLYLVRGQLKDRDRWFDEADLAPVTCTVETIVQYGSESSIRYVSVVGLRTVPVLPVLGRNRLQELTRRVQGRLMNKLGLLSKQVAVDLRPVSGDGFRAFQRNTRPPSVGRCVRCSGLYVWDGDDYVCVLCARRAPDEHVAQVLAFMQELDQQAYQSAGVQEGQE